MEFKEMEEKKKWDIEYTQGVWNYIDNPHSPALMAVINHYLRGGCLLDLGCGTGNTVAGLDTYSFYDGVDLSEVALRKANARYGNEKNHFMAANIVTYRPLKTYDVILLSEVICYIALANVCDVLQDYKKFLKKEGVFVVQIWNKDRYQDFINKITDNFHVIEEKILPGTGLTILLVFK
jgi:SAM-dependent methyltransferase